jgi:hypothetical protein
MNETGNGMNEAGPQQAWSAALVILPRCTGEG